MEKRNELYRGKAKSVFTTDDADRLILLFRNDTSAFDGKKIEQLERKGMVNNRFNAFIMQQLEAAGIPTQFDQLLSDTECLVKKLDMIPVECVVRNYAAGSLVKRLGVEEGMALVPPTFELFLKDDAKGDPFINASHVVTFGWATAEQLARMQELTLQARSSWVMSSARMAAASGTRKPARKWTRTVSVRGLVASSKPMKKWPVALASRSTDHLFAWRTAIRAPTAALLA